MSVFLLDWENNILLKYALSLFRFFFNLMFYDNNVLSMGKDNKTGSETKVF